MRCFYNPQLFNPSLSSTINDLDCSPHCGSEEDVTELCLKDYPCLESIHIGSYSFPNILSVEVRHLPKLKQFVVEDHCFVMVGYINLGIPCCVEDCPLLESISIGIGSFRFYSILSLNGNKLSCELNTRSSPSKVIVHGN